MILRRRQKRVNALALVLWALVAFDLGHAQEANVQGPADWQTYMSWLKEDLRRPAAVATLEAYLAAAGVKDVVPTWQLIRTATSWRQCGEPFAIPERRLWPSIVPTLVFVRDRIVPAIGPVQPVAVFRDDAINRCAGGARGSVHRRFGAVDLVPVRPLSIDNLTSALCPIHAAHGERARIGLGFYRGRRFHVDTGGFRTWGPDTRRASSPCLAPR
jgi:hypothetical protein